MFHGLTKKERDVIGITKRTQQAYSAATALDETLWSTMRAMQDGIGAINDYLQTTENEAEQQHYGLLRTCLQEAVAIIAADNGLTVNADIAF